MKTLEHDTALARALHSLQVSPTLYSLLAAVALEDPAATRPRLALRLGRSLSAIGMSILRHSDLFHIHRQLPYDQITLTQEGIELLLQIHNRKTHGIFKPENERGLATAPQRPEKQE